MKKMIGGLVLMTGILVMSQARAQAPAGATGQCNDSSYTTAGKKWQACAGHKGVKTWFADAKSGAATGAAPATPAPGTTTAAAAPATSAPAMTTNSPKATAVTTRSASAGSSAAASKAPAPGGGPGLVWLNTSTNVYHCPGGTFYGKTKDGKYVSEADAKKAGARPDRNKACS